MYGLLAEARARVFGVTVCGSVPPRVRGEADLFATRGPLLARHGSG